MIIVGGGIGGLYAAFLLRMHYPSMKVTVLEASSRLGGRIHTIYKHGVHYEGGAGRFSSNHHHLLGLLSKLGLDDMMYEMKGSKLFIKDSIPQPLFQESLFMDKLNEVAKKLTSNRLKNTNMLMFMRQILTPSESDDLIYAFGYQSEFEVCSAHHALKALNTNFLSTVKHFGLKGGLSGLVQALTNFLKDHACDILTNCAVVETDFRSKSTSIVHAISNGKPCTFTCDRVVFAVTKPVLSRLLTNDLHLQETLKTISDRPLSRVYAKFPTPAWFRGLPRVCTNNNLRHIIPINAEKGLIMLCYTDGLWADLWGNIKNKKRLQDELLLQARKLFPDKNIPDPEWIDDIFWDVGCHYPMPGHKKYNQPYASQYVVGGEVMTEDYNAWVEGALLATHKAIQKLNQTF